MSSAARVGRKSLRALTELIRENDLKAADIAKIEIGLSQSALRELVTPYPRDGEEAKFSIGFQIALYLNGLDNMPVNYREDVIRLPDVARIIQLTSMYNEPKYDGLPTDMGVGPAFGRIATVDGRVLTRERIYPDGHLTHPIPDQGIHDKYMKSALPVLGQEKAEELYRRLMALEEERDIRSLLPLARITMDGRVTRIVYPVREYSSAEVLSAVSGCFAIEDITIEEPDIDEVVSRIFAGEGML